MISLLNLRLLIPLDIARFQQILAHFQLKLQPYGLPADSLG